MAAMTGGLLTNPLSLQRALRQLLRKADAADIAVAFVGADWRLMLGEFEGALRLVCWLDNTATDPRSVEQILRVPHGVKQRTAMHAKVYLAHRGGQPVGAIVGSANLSRTALALTGGSGQVEVGVLVEDSHQLAELSTWFDAQWAGARPITQTDLDAAKEARKRRRRQDRRNKKRTRRKTNDAGPPALNPNDPQRLKDAIAAVKEVDLIADIQGFGHRGAVDFMQQLDPATMKRADAEKIVDYLQPWVLDTRGISRLPKESNASLRRSFTRILDEDRAVTDRLREELRDPRRARGLGLRSWSVLLYWRDPARCPPYNRRTESFLAAIGLAEDWPKTPSASTYGRWLEVAEQLRAEWELETLGHVDRVVWRYTASV